MSRSIGPTLAALSLLLPFLAPFRLHAQAQAFTASLTGTITDPSGASVPGAKLTLANPQQGFVRTANTANDGSYTFSLLPPGTYSIKVEKSGFRPLVRNDIGLTVGGSTGLNLTLEVGTATEAIVVTAQPPMLNTSNASVGSEVSQRQVAEMPLNLRNVYGLVTLDSSVNNSTQKQLLNPGGVNSDYDDQDIARYTHPPLSTVLLPNHEMGRWAADSLIAQVRASSLSKAAVKMDCPLVARDSVAPPRA